MLPVDLLTSLHLVCAVCVCVSSQMFSIYNGRFHNKNEHTAQHSTAYYKI